MSKEEQADTLPKRPYACWLLADNTLGYAKVASKSNRFNFKCLLKHTLLFNIYRQKLVLSDSQVINNASLRMLVRQDDDMQRLMQMQQICIAKRQDATGSVKSLEEMRSDFAANGKYLFDVGKYGEGGELDLLELCPSVEYSLAEISQRYEEKVLEIFRGRAKAVLPQALMKQIASLAVEERGRLRSENPDSRLGWIFFYKQLQDLLKPSDWKTYQGQINDCAQAPFHSGLPSLLNADPVYAKQHAKSFDLMRGHRQAGRLEEVKLSFEGVLGLAEYQRGIAALEVDDILELLDTDEAGEFADSRDAIDGSRYATDRTLRSLRLYAQRVEDHILRHQPDLRNSANNEREQTASVEILKFPHRIAEVAGIFNSWVSAGLFAFDRLVYDKLTESSEELRLRQEREATASREIEVEKLRKKWDAESEPKIESDLVKKKVKDPADETIVRERVELDEIETFYRD